MLLVIGLLELASQVLLLLPLHLIEPLVKLVLHSDVFGISVTLGSSGVLLHLLFELHLLIELVTVGELGMVGRLPL
jgi:hypothetical protein